jgi:hypothetical protein
LQLVCCMLLGSPWTRTLRVHKPMLPRQIADCLGVWSRARSQLLWQSGIERLSSAAVTHHVERKLLQEQLLLMHN